MVQTGTLKKLGLFILINLVIISIGMFKSMCAVATTSRRDIMLRRHQCWVVCPGCAVSSQPRHWLRRSAAADQGTRSETIQVSCCDEGVVRTVEIPELLAFVDPLRWLSSRRELLRLQQIFDRSAGVPILRLITADFSMRLTSRCVNKSIRHLGSSTRSGITLSDWFVEFQLAMRNDLNIRVRHDRRVQSLHSKQPMFEIGPASKTGR